MIVMLASPDTPPPPSRISIIANRSFTKERSFRMLQNLLGQ